MFWFLLMVTCSSSGILAKTIRIGLFENNRFTSVQVILASGKWSLQSDEYTGRTLAAMDKTKFLAVKDSVMIQINEERSFTNQVILKSIGKGAVKINPLEPPVSPKLASDEVEILAINGQLIVINSLPLETYIAGVVDAETGRLRNPGFYKAQAILCRTYALHNLDRHILEDFDLCDGTHCQKFKGVTDYPDIIKAAHDTKGLVAVDRNYDLVMAAYHSNCGGQTVPSQWVWQIELPYFVTVNDTFCKNEKHASWKIKIPANNWKKYFGNVVARKEAMQWNDSAFIFIQKNRQRYYFAGTDSIQFTRLRNDWKVNSSFFDVQYAPGTFILNGRGFGHGVGLCQEGA
ncbi:MAG: SpoIID/LytB domain-containing protein, partial [Bacteroidetes bacterium]|nr:SpoIID/LytB domain-containing protein [Bacteroidota bacterium]